MGTNLKRVIPLKNAHTHTHTYGQNHNEHPAPRPADKPTSRPADPSPQPSPAPGVARPPGPAGPKRPALPERRRPCPDLGWKLSPSENRTWGTPKSALAWFCSIFRLPLFLGPFCQPKGAGESSMEPMSITSIILDHELTMKLFRA